MTTTDPSHLLAPDEGPPVEVLNRDGRGTVLLVCEHASRFIPRSLGRLGLDAEAETSHAAWDIGARDLALAMSAALDAPLVAARVSRLVYDCNRPPGAHDAIPARSERFAIPGNADLSDAARRARVADVYAPFRRQLSETLAARSDWRALVTVHSFTPVFNGQRRSVELGLLHDADARLAEAMMSRAPARTGLETALNQPYAAADGVTHTLREHALPAGLPNVMIELRNDLIATPEDAGRVGAELVALLLAALDAVPAAIGTRDIAQG